MTIPHDPLKRWWVELAAVNSDRVDEFRPSLLAVVAVGPGYDYRIVGTGFVLAGTNDFALAITAKHVLIDGAAKIQQPHQRHVPSALFAPRSEPSLSPQMLKAAWMGTQHADMMNVLHASYNSTLDIACCVVMPQGVFPGSFHPVSIPLDTAVPRMGDVVHMVSQDGMLLDELTPPADGLGKDQTLSLTKRISIRIGVVTGVHPQGLRHYKWPCFTTSIPAEPGMSGGFVTLPRDGVTIAACGIVCADSSSSEARIDQTKCGESVIACAWPALGLRAPDSIPSTPETHTFSLYEMMRSGRLDHPVGGLDCIRFLEKEHGDCTLERREAVSKRR